MSRKPYSSRPAYVQSIRGLLRLHELAQSGQDESPEADAIRDSLERPWYELSEVEKKRIAGLSEDLYAISEPPSQPHDMKPQAQRKLLEADTARQSGAQARGRSCETKRRRDVSGSDPRLRVGLVFGRLPPRP